MVPGFELSEATKGDDLVTQGDAGDYVYLIYEGECKVIVDGNAIPDPYGTVRPAAIFGELAFLYDEARAILSCPGYIVQGYHVKTQRGTAEYASY